MNNNKLIFLGLIPVLMLLVSNVYAEGQRFDSPEGESQEVQDCYREGYEQGFAHRYNEDRADECEENGKDWYNIAWGGACINSGQTKQHCDRIKERIKNADLPELDKDETYGGCEEQSKGLACDIENVDDLGNQNMGKCWDDGFEDGQNNPFNQERDFGCGDYRDMYYKGFIAGCESAGNTKEMCSSSGHNNFSGDNSNEPDRLKVTVTLNIPFSWYEREFKVNLRTEGVSYTEYKDGCTGDVEFAPAPIDINEEFTVCTQASNGVVNGCQSSVNGPEAGPERITVD
jgi:hypothetical protein